MKLFTKEAVSWAILSFKPYKSAGPDGIIPILFQKGLDLVITAVRIFLINSHAWNHATKAWQKVNVIHILKVGRKAGLAKSLRPISLSCYPLKIQERVLDRHLRETVIPANPIQNKPVCLPVW